MSSTSHTSSIAAKPEDGKSERSSKPAQSQGEVIPAQSAKEIQKYRIAAGRKPKHMLINARMPADTHSYGRRLSADDAASTSTTSTQPKDRDHSAEISRKSSISKVIARAKAKLSRQAGESLPDDEEEFERQKAKEIKKEGRRADYERLGLDDRVKFGAWGARGFNSM